MSICMSCRVPLADRDGFVETSNPSSSTSTTHNATSADASLVWTETARLCYTCHWFPPHDTTNDASSIAAARCVHCTDVPCPRHAPLVAKSLAQAKLDQTRSSRDVSMLPVSHEEHVLAEAYQNDKCLEYTEYHQSKGWGLMGTTSTMVADRPVDATPRTTCTSMDVQCNNDAEEESEETWVDYFQIIHPKASHCDDESMTNVIMEDEPTVCETCHAGFPWREGQRECDSCQAKASRIEATCLACHEPTGAAWQTHCWPECYKENHSEHLQPTPTTRATEGGQTRPRESADWPTVSYDTRPSKRIKAWSGICASCGCSGVGPRGMDSRCEQCAGKQHVHTTTRELTLMN